MLPITTSRNIILVSFFIKPLHKVAPPTLLSDLCGAGRDMVVHVVLSLSDAVLDASLVTLILKIPDVLDGFLDQSRADGGRVRTKAVDDVVVMILRVVVVVVHVAHCSRSVGVVKGFR